MKKLLALPFIVALVISGCSLKTETDKPLDEKESGLNPIVFTSIASEDGTKVAIDGLNLKFTAGDNIAVASYNFASETAPITSDYASFNGTEPSTSGTFTPATHAYGSDWSGSASAVSFYAYYPTSAAPSINKTAAAISNIADVQDGTLSSIVCWAKGANVATAAEVNEGNAPNFNFSPVCALLKLTIVNNDDMYNTSLSSISFTASSGNKIAGTASLNLLTGSLSGGSSSTIAYTPASTLELEKAGGSTTVYISLIPTTITSLVLAFSDIRSTGVDYSYSVVFDKDLPATLLPGRMYERTLTISDIVYSAVSGSLGTFNGIKFVRGLLKRDDTSTTDATHMSVSDETVNPLEILDYANKTTTSDSYKMYFSWNDLRTIFGGSVNNSFDGNSITIGSHSYSVPSKANYESLYSITRNSNPPTVNGVAKAWSCVQVTLTDSESATGTDYDGKGFSSNTVSSNFVKGLLLFPDGAAITCADIVASKCDIFNAETYASPNTITTSQLMILINGGCLFLPSIGGHQNTNPPAWNSRGTNGYYWTSTYDGGSKILVIQGQNPEGISIGQYSAKRQFPVALIQAD